MNSQEHDLTDDEFAELLLRADSAVAANEADSEAAALRSAFRSYRAETLQWAERRSATQPSLQPAARRSRFWAGVPQWSLAAVAVISIAAGVAHVYDRPGTGGDDTPSTTQGAVTAVSVARTSDADIAADNRLMSSIDRELSYHSESTVDSLGLKPAPNNRTVIPGVTN